MFTSKLASSGTASRIVGTSGSCALRSALVTASARSLPARTCSITPVRLSTRKPTWFASSSVCAGAEPRNGTWIAWAFSNCSIHTGERCVDCPTPVEA